MKKNYAFRVHYYTVYSDKPISLLMLQPIIMQAKKKNKFDKVFQVKKQKYKVIIERTIKPIKSFTDFIDVENEINDT